MVPTVDEGLDAGAAYTHAPPCKIRTVYIHMHGAPHREEGFLWTASVVEVTLTRRSDGAVNFADIYMDWTPLPARYARWCIYDVSHREGCVYI
jgi:hypothetical protein